MLDFLRKHTIVIMAAMALVFVGLMFIGGDISGSSISNMFHKTVVSVDGKSYGEKDLTNMGNAGLRTAFTLPSLSPLIQDNFRTDAELQDLCMRLKTNNPQAAFLAWRGIIRREANRLGLTPDLQEIDRFIRQMPEFCNEKGEFEAKKYDEYASGRGKQGKKLQEEILRGLVQDLLSLERIKQVLTNGISIENDFAQSVAESLDQQITINTALLNKEDFRPKGDPGEEAIKAFWDKYKDNYRSNEARFFTVYEFIPSGNTTGEAGQPIANATLETMNLVENDVWEPSNVVNGHGLENIIADALKKSPQVCKSEKKSYTAVTRDNAPQELLETINQSASDGRSSTLLDVVFALNGAPTLPLNADSKTIEDAISKIKAEQISTMQVLENGKVVLIRLEGITPVGTLPYEQARNMARADLLDQMTTEALTKATDELKVKLDKDTDALSNFATQANQAGAKVATYGPFVNPDTLLSNINLSAANSQAELQAVLEKALSSPLAPSQELPEPGKVFQECTTINPGKTTNPINTGNGLMIVQLVKRELQDSPEFRVKMTQRVIPALTNQTQSLILSDWLRSCIDQYKVEVDPMVNRQN